MALTVRNAIPGLLRNSPARRKDFVNPLDWQTHDLRLPFESAAFDTRAIEPLLRTRDDVGAGMRVGWELLHLLQLSVRSLEDTATRVVAAQVAGLVALWTQLYTF